MLPGTKPSFTTSIGALASAAIEYTRLVLSSTSPPAERLQCSNTLMVPNRLCSTSWRLLTCPVIPASTLGFAAASITQSTVAEIPDRWRYGHRRGKNALRIS